jgi:hypothetical protein
MKKILTGVIFLAASCYLHAQKKVSFSTQNYVGILAGESDTGPQVQTINGISFNKWFTGIGSGIDWYYQRSVPLFLLVERGLKITPSRNIYISSGAGVNFPWSKEYYNDWGWWQQSKKYPGLFLNAGIGYRIPVSKNNDAVLLHIGYSNKNYREKVTSSMPCINPPCPENTETYNYKLRTVSFKLGYGF